MKTKSLRRRQDFHGSPRFGREGVEFVHVAKGVQSPICKEHRVFAHVMF